MVAARCPADPRAAVVPGVGAALFQAAPAGAVVPAVAAALFRVARRAAVVPGVVAVACRAWAAQTWGERNEASRFCGGVVAAAS